jgi:flavin reductase (DIM6/NTAB) family NADH-FMN oxidoreductase RutF
VLAEIATRAGCRVEGWAETGYAYLVTGVVESLDIGDVDDPLVYFKARYARLTANVD